MTDEADKRAKLVANREKIAEEAKKLADASDKKFLIDAGFIGGLGTAITTIFSQYGGSAMGSSILGASSASLIALSHVMGTFNKEFYTTMSEKAKDEAFLFEHDGAIESEQPIRFQDYERKFDEGYEKKLSSLKTIRSAAIVCGFSAMAAFALTQDSNNEARKDEELEDTLSQDSYPVLVHQQ